MASSLLFSCSLTLPFCKLKELNKYAHKVRSQCSRDDGTSANIVDANMGILRERITEVKMKERLLDKCCKLRNGWNYQSADYDHSKYKRCDLLSKSSEIVSLAAGAVGLVFLSGSLCICLVSILVHFNH